MLATSQHQISLSGEISPQPLLLPCSASAEPRPSSCESGGHHVSNNHASLLHPAVAAFPLSPADRG